MKKTLKPPTKRVLALGLALLLCAAVAVYLVSRRDEQVAETVTYSTDNPSEQRPGDDYEWKGGPRDPKKIIIPSIGVDAFIQNVGVDQRGEVAVPNNLFVVGWFVQSVRPGEKGLSVIDGHVSGRKNDGIFKDLERLKEGDVYTVQFGDGSSKNFRVIGKQSVPLAGAVSVIFSQQPKVSNQLNLVTCSGEFDAKSRTYSERLVVFSQQQ